jgi:hypothetical protein
MAILTTVNGSGHVSCALSRIDVVVSKTAGCVA